MPPMRAASARLIPSRTAARDRRRRLWLAFLVAAASRRSSLAEKSVRILTAAGMVQVLPTPSDPLFQKEESPRESKRMAAGMTSREEPGVDPRGASGLPPRRFAGFARRRR